ncbi:MAG: hypothetical protein IT373_22635 [Polyangiaceae bacterium]|nr:hypothetical protein [Polyangiaceae bacterium]
MPRDLDAARLDAIVSAVCARLDGQWLLIGGALVALWLEPRRVTEDVDLIGLGGSADERYALMELAAELGLPVEAVNSAADFFVRRISGWRGELVEWRRGARGVVYRPSATLFVLLKVPRLSEQDLADCLAAVEHGRRTGEVVDGARVARALSLLPAAADDEQSARRARLREALELR